MAEADPRLRRAVAVERTARDAATAFEVESSRFLADAGLGLAVSGEAGTSAPGQASRASIRAGTVAWEAGPEGYSKRHRKARAPTASPSQTPAGRSLPTLPC
jgi:hypothetical protein